MPTLDPRILLSVLTSCAVPARFAGPFSKYRAYARLLTRRGPHAYKQNELNADKITSLSERLDYEAIIQYTRLKDNDLLYFSYTNQARRLPGCEAE